MPYSFKKVSFLLHVSNLTKDKHQQCICASLIIKTFLKTPKDVGTLNLEESYYMSFMYNTEPCNTKMCLYNCGLKNTPEIHEGLEKRMQTIDVKGLLNT